MIKCILDMLTFHQIEKKSFLFYQINKLPILKKICMYVGCLGLHHENISVIA